MPTLIANAAGEISGKFTIPAGIRAGSKAVVVQGAGGSHGVGTFTGRGTITTEERQVVTTISENWAGWDPLAETFTLSEARHVAGVDLWFTACGANDVVVQIRDTANGFPSRTVLAERRIKATDIKLGGNSTRILFDAPAWLDSGHEYALVLATDSADTAIAIAELGKFDSSAQKWITQQAYQVGVLLSSSNANTWTSHQEKDIAFRLLGCRFSNTAKTVDLGAVPVKNATDLLALMNIQVPATGVKAELIVKTADGTSYRMVPGTPVSLPAQINGNLALSVALTGTEKASPVVFPGLQFAAGTMAEQGTYVSRSFACGTTARISVTFEAVTPGSSTVVAEIQKTDGSWQTLALTSGADVGGGWAECRYVVTGFSAPSTRVRLTLKGSAQYRPRVRKLRAVATD